MSNGLPILASLIVTAHRGVLDAATTSAERAIEAGHALVEAKDLVQHGEWLAFLRTTGLSERKAQRYMVLARAGLKSDTVTHLGGIAAAVAYLSRRKLPRPGPHVIAYNLSDNLCAWVWPSDKHAGYFHVGGVDLGENLEHGTAFASIRPMKGDVIICDDGNVDPVWDFLAHQMRGLVARFETVDAKIDRETVSIFGGSVDGVAS